MGTVCSIVFKKFSCQKLTLGNIKIIMKTQHCVILLVSVWTLLRDTLCQQVKSKESADGDEIKKFNESFISEKLKYPQKIAENLKIAMEEATECKEDLTLNLDKIKEIRFLLHYGTNSPKTHERIASPAESHDNFGFKKFAGNESRKETQEWLNRINGWSSKEKLSEALRHLNRATIGRWFLQLNTLNTWTNFQRHFHERHIVEESDTQKWQRLVQRLQEENEMTYFAEKLSFCKAVGLNLDQTGEQILFDILSYEVYLQSWILLRLNQLSTEIHSKDGENDQEDLARSLSGTHLDPRKSFIVSVQCQPCD